MLVQTFAFVAFNKVITAQYFTWFAFLILLVLPVNTENLKFKRKKSDADAYRNKFERKIEKNVCEKERNYAMENIEKYTEKRIEKINNNNSTVTNVYFNIFLILLLWIFSLSFWLIQAYLLEFLGENTFLLLWYASILFHIVNSIIIVIIVLYFKEEKEKGNKKGK
jgi:Mannosyltransferase (PIG-M)